MAIFPPGSAQAFSSPLLSTTKSYGSGRSATAARRLPTWRTYSVMRGSVT